MKKNLVILFLMLGTTVFAKDAINYQAIIRTSDGKVVASKTITVQMTLLNDLINQNAIYQEIHTITTNDLGMINLKIGLGEPIIGLFDNIDWGTGSYFIQVAFDFEGGTNYEIIGTTQLLSVPYALYAKKSGELNVANLSDDFVNDLASKLNLKNEPTLVDSKITNADYKPIAETKDVVVYQYKTGYPIEAVYNNIAIVKISNSQFKIGENGINGNFDIIVNLNSTSFPNLISGSVISKIILLPWNRNAIAPVPAKEWRCCVITDKGQIYHNFPNRTSFPGLQDGIALTGDINRWDESVVWDLPTRRLPSKTTDIFPFSLNPCLPENAYKIFPAINTDNGYGHGGFNITCTHTVGIKQVEFPRFYFHKRTDGNNPFFYMHGFETSMKVQLIGTYRSNTTPENAARICIFGTTDGGRQWYNKYEFAQNGIKTFGNTIIGSKISQEYKSGSLFFQKRDFIVPSSTYKEPVDLFKYGIQISIDGMIKSDSSLIFSTLQTHNLKTGDLIVVFKKDIINISGYEFLCNENINTKNGGNGKIWKVEVLTPTTFKIYEYINNPDSNLPVRHIHAINRIKDGFIISTGETYPQSWIMYLQIKYSDTYALVNAWDNFNILRLTSSENSVQRTLGTIMYDDEDQTIIFASDDEILSNDNYTIEGRNDLSISRSSTGVYKGKLADIDDFKKFTCIYEAKQVAFHFKEINDMLIFAGQQGELAISIDRGKTWRKFNLYGNYLAQQYPKGIDDKGRYVLDQVIIYRK